MNRSRGLLPQLFFMAIPGHGNFRVQVSTFVDTRMSHEPGRPRECCKRLVGTLPILLNVFPLLADAPAWLERLDTKAKPMPTSLPAKIAPRTRHQAVVVSMGAGATGFLTFLLIPGFEPAQAGKLRSQRAGGPAETLTS
jgi:hypothetical protein